MRKLNMINKFLKTCTEIGVECCDESITDIIRLGKYEEMTATNENYKPRPILISLGNAVKERVMRNAYKLKNCSDQLMKSIGISHDMNKEERQRDKELRSEAKKKNMAAQGTEFFYVVRGHPWERAIVERKRKVMGGEGGVAQTA